MAHAQILEFCPWCPDTVRLKWMRLLVLEKLKINLIPDVVFLFSSPSPNTIPKNASPDPNLDCGLQWARSVTNIEESD